MTKLKFMKRFNKLNGRNWSTLLMIVSVFGIISYILLAFAAPFKGNLFNVLFQRPFSNAQVIPSGQPLTAPLSTPPPIQIINPSANVDLTINPSTNSMTVGQIFSLTLDANTNGGNLDAAEIHLNFDPTKLEAESITQGTFLKDLLVAGTFDKSG